MANKSKIYLKSGITALLLVFFLSFLVYYSNPSITGLAISDSSNSSLSLSFSKQDAENAILESELLIANIKNKGLPTSYMDDALVQAKNILNTLNYAEILNSKDSTSEQISEANSVLRLTNWKKMNYSDIGVITTDIKERSEWTILLLDRLALENKKITEETSQQTKEILDKANNAFDAERYNETEKFLEEFILAYEKEQEQKTTLSTLQESSKNFIQKNWLYILVSLIILLFIYYFAARRIKKKILIKKIQRMQNEKIILTDLIKKTQRERFETKKLSGIVYNIRLKKYQDRLREIEQELPVMEKFLKKAERR